MIALILVLAALAAVVTVLVLLCGLPDPMADLKSINDIRTRRQARQDTSGGGRR